MNARKVSSLDQTSDGRSMTLQEMEVRAETISTSTFDELYLDQLSFPP